MPPMQVVWVLSLVRDLRPHMPQSMTKKPEPKKKKKPKGNRKTYIGKLFSGKSE